MNKKLYLVLGNGFTLDFLGHVEHKNNLIKYPIDVTNLFTNGASVPWPATKSPGFLSFKHCPHLWNLGARTNMTASDAMALIEDVITCVNVSALKSPVKAQTDRPNDVYIFAYQELMEYLRHLFIYYNNQITGNLKKATHNWSWLKYLKRVYDDSSYSEIVIVTYNYDIWLERVLMTHGLKFDVQGIGTPAEGDGCKIKLYKPHGSISFVGKHENDQESYEIKRNRELADGDPANFDVKYTELQNNYIQSAIIPPAGDSTRLAHTWAGSIRKKALDSAGSLNSSDEVIICGLSYWHVDRAELDSLFATFDPAINISMINPDPNRTMNAVLTSIFSNFVVFPSSKILNGK